MNYILIFCTIDNFEKAKGISRKLVEDKLIACANIVPNITSVYTWNGKICDDKEFLMIMKTRADKFEDVKTSILKLHPYETPEVISVKIDNGSINYLKWINMIVS